MIRGRVPPAVLLAGRAVLVLVAVVPLFLLLTRAAPSGPVGTAAPPPGGLGGIGTGLSSSGTPAPGATDAQLDPGAPGAPPSPVPVNPVPVNPGPAGPAAAGGGGAVAPPAPVTGTTPAPAPVPLRAAYATTATSMTGYTGQVTLTNPGAVARATWTVALTLPTGEVVAGVSGANHSILPTGTVTFTPGPAVPAHGSVRFTFTVTGPLGDPRACTIDGRPCG
jgi:Cellulose binding domain